jgi:hypothetical protein
MDPYGGDSMAQVVDRGDIRDLGDQVLANARQFQCGRPRDKRTLGTDSRPQSRARLPPVAAISAFCSAFESAPSYGAMESLAASFRLDPDQAGSERKGSFCCNTRI